MPMAKPAAPASCRARRNAISFRWRANQEYRGSNSGPSHSRGRRKAVFLFAVPVLPEAMRPSLHKSRPECMQIGFVTRHHSFGERVSIEDAVHHACETIRVCVV